MVRRVAEEAGRPLVELDFEREPLLADLFESRDPDRVLRVLEARYPELGAEEGAVLLLDEIQAAPDALASLRYFFERRPEIPLVAAGSLLDLALEDPAISVPVGRVGFLHLGPLLFDEYLRAREQPGLSEFLGRLDPGEEVDPVLHRDLMLHFREYLVVGGMPRSAALFAGQGSHTEALEERHSLLTAFESDFAKYGDTVSPSRLRKIFQAAPRLMCRPFRYSLVDRQERSRDLSSALEQLCRARVLHRVHRSSAAGVPLGAQVDERSFKLLFLDVGLASTALGVDALAAELAPDLLQIEQGAVVEQAVGQHLLGTIPNYRPPELHFWARAQRSSTAEVDFVISVGRAVVPVEVKAGKTGRLRSLLVFVQERGSSLAVRLWSEPPRLDEVVAELLPDRPPVTFRLLSLPLYMAGQVRRLAAAALGERVPDGDVSSR